MSGCEEETKIKIGFIVDPDAGLSERSGTGSMQELEDWIFEHMIHYSNEKWFNQMNITLIKGPVYERGGLPPGSSECIQEFHAFLEEDQADIERDKCDGWVLLGKKEQCVFSGNAVNGAANAGRICKFGNVAFTVVQNREIDGFVRSFAHEVAHLLSAGHLVSHTDSYLMVTSTSSAGFFLDPGEELDLNMLTKDHICENIIDTRPKCYCHKDGNICENPPPPIAPPPPELSDTTQVQPVIEEVDCVFTDWSEWTGCSTCEEIKINRKIEEFRNRNTITSLEVGEKCSDISEEKRNCDECLVDCVFTDWSEWTGCSCVEVDEVRNRTTTTALKNGEECSEISEEKQMCNRDECILDCVFTDWSEWTGCSTCEEVEEFRNRTTTTVLKMGEECSEISEEKQNCNLDDCKGTFENLKSKAVGFAAGLIVHKGIKVLTGDFGPKASGGRGDAKEYQAKELGAFTDWMKKYWWIPFSVVLGFIICYIFINCCIKCRKTEKTLAYMGPLIVDEKLRSEPKKKQKIRHNR